MHPARQPARELRIKIGLGADHVVRRAPAGPCGLARDGGGSGIAGAGPPHSHAVSHCLATRLHMIQHARIRIDHDRAGAFGTVIGHLLALIALGQIGCANGGGRDHLSVRAGIGAGLIGFGHRGGGQRDGLAASTCG